MRVHAFTIDPVLFLISTMIYVLKLLLCVSRLFCLDRYSLSTDCCLWLISVQVLSYILDRNVCLLPSYFAVNEITKLFSDDRPAPHWVLCSFCRIEFTTVFNMRQSYCAHDCDIGLTSVCLSNAGIVSKWLNLSSNCLHCLVAPRF